MRTRKTGREEIPALKALWQEAFGDEQQDIDLFFETVYPNATGFCAEDGGELVSMLFALPQTIVKEEKQLKCAYLYAVATKKDRQGEGLCSALLAYAEKELRKRYVEDGRKKNAARLRAADGAGDGNRRAGLRRSARDGAVGHCARAL